MSTNFAAAVVKSMFCGFRGGPVFVQDEGLLSVPFNTLSKIGTSEKNQILCFATHSTRGNLMSGDMGVILGRASYEESNLEFLSIESNKSTSQDFLFNSINFSDFPKI